MNEFTKGEYKVADAACVYVLNLDGANRIWAGVSSGFDDEGVRTPHKEVQATAELFATAGTAATALAEAGYDAVEVFRALPEILQYIKNRKVYGDPFSCRLLRRIKGE